MEHETLFTASKWEILKQLEQRERSPLELAKICSTSVANISQQLRLLEMAGLVTRRRISNRDKGKPRILYSLAGNLSYVIATSDRFVEKKVLQLSDYNKIIMRIWFFEHPELRYTLEKAFWKIEENLPKILFLAFDKEHTSPVTFYYTPVGKGFQIRPFTVTDAAGVTRQVIFDDKRPSSVQHLHILYDPKGIASSAAPENTLQKRTRGDGT
jgi:DNA-binding transcriptional ArsR family regulator